MGKDEVKKVASKMLPYLSNDGDRKVAAAGFNEGNVRVRALLSCPPLSEDECDAGILTGDIIMNYIHACLDTSKAPKTCARRYSYEMWGDQHYEIVKWFKDLKVDQGPVLENLCESLG
ncbi:MAG: hypothetical protein JKY31_00325 [Rhodobacteraceae bacterium]|nr:hypothetical protein [Paracoccaceae bacterium]